jgi:hypothetical protein
MIPLASLPVNDRRKSRAGTTNIKGKRTSTIFLWLGFGGTLSEGWLRYSIHTYIYINIEGQVNSWFSSPSRVLTFPVKAFRAKPQLAHHPHLLQHSQTTCLPINRLDNHPHRCSATSRSLTLAPRQFQDQAGFCPTNKSMPSSTFSKRGLNGILLKCKEGRLSICTGRGRRPFVEPIQLISLANTTTYVQHSSLPNLNWQP